MNSICDSRLMSQVRDLSGCLDTVKALAPKHMYNQRTSRGDVALVGQASQSVTPEVISAGADGYLRMDYERLSVWLIGAIQELDTRLAALEAKAAGDASS